MPPAARVSVVVGTDQLDALLVRVSAVLERARATPPARGRAGPAKVVSGADAIFYRLGVVDQADHDRVAFATLTLEAVGARSRELLIGLWGSKGKIVLATRWVPGEDRPLIRRGEPRADAWTRDTLESALDARVAEGRERFEKDVREGRGHFDSSGDLLSLPRE
jgi:hypothetical protein